MSRGDADKQGQKRTEDSNRSVAQRVVSSVVTGSDGDKRAAKKNEAGTKAQPMQIRRFCTGVMFSALGVGLMLMVAAGLLHDAGLGGDLSLPFVGLCMIFGVMFLGGGFGIMATSSATFDDGEFDRLMRNEKNARTEDSDSGGAGDRGAENSSAALSFAVVADEATQADETQPAVTDPSNQTGEQPISAETNSDRRTELLSA